MRIERRFVVLVLSKPKAQTWDFSSYRGWWTVAEFVKVAAKAGGSEKSALKKLRTKDPQQLMHSLVHSNRRDMAWIAPDA